jgi:hypothetical protein
VPVYDFTAGNNRLFLPGNCDDTILKLIKEVGWEEEYEAIIKGYDAKYRVPSEPSKAE